MTFGTPRWGANEDVSRAIFDTYIAAGGNFIDTADVYSGGASEELLGRFLIDAGLRSRIVLATKSGFGTGDHPNAGGNGAKHLHDALNGSLKRLRTDYVDLYWLHVWDMVTPAEEVLQTMSALVRSGKVRYWGMSNAPAWYVAKLATLAAAHAMIAPIGLQYEYSLVERGVEQELVPAAADLGLSLQPWSPLGGGFLSGKYSRDDPANVAGQRAPELPDGKIHTDSGEGRLAGANPFGDSKFTARNWDILDVLNEIAAAVDATPAQVSLSWAVRQPGVASVLIGASKAEQLVSNMGALDIDLSDEQLCRLDQVSAPQVGYPGSLFTPMVKRFVFGGHEVGRWRS